MRLPAVTRKIDGYGRESAASQAIDDTPAPGSRRPCETVEEKQMSRDVHAFRRALGIDEWNVWGLSYGTILGQAYINEDPDGIRAIVLDSVVPINAVDEDQYWRVIKWYDRDLKKLDELCQADKACAESSTAHRVR